MDTKKNIYVVGSSGFAKEVYFLIKETNQYNFKGFIEYKPRENFLTLNGETLPIIDEDTFLSENKKETIAIGVGRPYLIKKICEKFKHFDTPNIIHPTFIGDTNNIIHGVGNIITAGVIFTTNITIGSFNVFNLNMTIGHDTVIGDYNVFNPSTNISGNNTIGKQNLFGVGSISLENMLIGDNNVIGAGALITKNIDDDGVYIGTPAKLIKNNDN
jgi:sugar O-acyltransferase (sialic acid O-acetyltransferase NeuD family)